MKHAHSHSLTAYAASSCSDRRSRSGSPAPSSRLHATAFSVGVYARGNVTIRRLHRVLLSPGSRRRSPLLLLAAVVLALAFDRAGWAWWAAMLMLLPLIGLTAWREHEKGGGSDPYWGAGDGGPWGPPA